MISNLSTSMKLLGSLLLLVIVDPAGVAQERNAFLQPPGLRLINDPIKVIPSFYQYPNRPLILPNYLDPLGTLASGWARRIIRTRSFSSRQSARLYFRTADLAQSLLFQVPGPLSEVRIWPEGTLIILEVYDGDDSLVEGAGAVEIGVMAKAVSHRAGPSTSFYPMDWSYALFGRDGKPRLVPTRVQECHQCHSIAFYLTGDLIFTRFTGGGVSSQPN
jgi:hypothetical protein